METQIISQIVWAWVATQVIEQMKKWSKLTWISVHTETVNRIVAAIFAFLSSLGIAWSFDKEAGTLLISGLTITGIMPLFWTFVQQTVLQQIVYRGAVKETPKEAAVSAKVLAADIKEDAK